MGVHRRVGMSLAAAAALLGAAGLVTAGTSAPASRDLGPTATATRRDLRTTTSISGTLARADTTTIVYGGTPEGRAEETRSLDGVALTAATSADEEGGDESDPSDETTTSTTTSSTTTTSTTSTTTTSTTSTSTTSTSVPPSSTTSTRAPPEKTPSAPRPTVAPAPASRAPTMPARVGPAPAGPAGDAPSSPAAETEDERAIITALVAIGSIADRGSTLYRANDEPTVALIAADPLLRDLEVGIEGADVRALEENLVALGFGAGLTVDEVFDAETKAAVEDWEAALGRVQPDGVVTVGEVRLLAEPAAVLTHEVEVGDTVTPGDPIMTLGTESQVVEAELDATSIGEWPVGAEVEVLWADGTASSGAVIELGRDEDDGTVRAVASLTGVPSGHPVGTEVDVVRTTAARDNAVAVPVAAVIEGDDGPAVRVVKNERDEVVTVELGVVADGWVEITRGLDAGTEVRLPG